MQISERARTVCRCEIRICAQTGSWNQGRKEAKAFQEEARGDRKKNFCYSERLGLRIKVSWFPRWRQTGKARVATWCHPPYSAAGRVGCCSTAKKREEELAQPNRLKDHFNDPLKAFLFLLVRLHRVVGVSRPLSVAPYLSLPHPLQRRVFATQQSLGYHDKTFSSRRRWPPASSRGRGQIRRGAFVGRKLISFCALWLNHKAARNESPPSLFHYSLQGRYRALNITSLRIPFYQIKKKPFLNVRCILCDTRVWCLSPFPLPAAFTLSPWLMGHFLRLPTPNEERPFCDFELEIDKRGSLMKGSII